MVKTFQKGKWKTFLSPLESKLLRHFDKTVDSYVVVEFNVNYVYCPVWVMLKRDIY